MADQDTAAAGASSSSDGGTAGAEAPRGHMMEELAPFGGDPTLPKQDEDLIMATLFGGPENKQNSADSQGAQGGNAQGSGASADGSSGGTAPQPGASGSQSGSSAPAGNQAAQGAGAARQELPAFPGAGSAQQAAGATQQPQSPSQGAQPSDPASAPAAVSSELAEMRLQVQNLTGTVAALQTALTQARQQGSPGGPGTQPGNQQPGGGGQSDLAKQSISLAVPPDVAGAILGEDPQLAQAGMNHLMSAVATATYQRTIAAVDQLIEQKLGSFQGQLQQQTEGQRIEADFYGAFPALNNELYRPLVAQTYNEVFTSMPGLSWGPDARNAVGSKVIEKLKILGINISTVQPPQPNGADSQPQQERGPVSQGGNGAAAAATPMMGTGTRPANSGGDSAENFIAATLG